MYLAWIPRVAKTTTPCVAEAHFATAAVNINKKIVLGMIQLFREKRKTNKVIYKNVTNSFCSTLSSQHKNRNLIVKPEVYIHFRRWYKFRSTIFFFFFISGFIKNWRDLDKRSRDILCLMQEIMYTRACAPQFVYLSQCVSIASECAKIITRNCEPRV